MRGISAVAVLTLTILGLPALAVTQEEPVHAVSGGGISAPGWQGAPQLPGHPRVWRFAFGPTVIPGAPTVRIYVSPLGQVVATDPADLAERVKALHPY